VLKSVGSDVSISKGIQIDSNMCQAGTMTTLISS